MGQCVIQCDRGHKGYAVQAVRAAKPPVPKDLREVGTRLPIFGVVGLGCQRLVSSTTDPLMGLEIGWVILVWEEFLATGPG